MAFLDKNGLSRLWAYIIEHLGEKVDKVDGKGLSTNDYTDEDKAQLGAVSDELSVTVDNLSAVSSTLNDHTKINHVTNLKNGYTSGSIVGINASNFDNGENSVSLGDASHAMGKNSFAAGSTTSARGDNSTALGRCTKANGSDSFAIGSFTIASGKSQNVQGKFNVEDTRNRYAHIVGGGNSNDTRANIHTLDWNGDAWYGGNIYVGENNQKLPTSWSDLGDVVHFEERIITATDDSEQYMYGGHNYLRASDEVFSIEDMFSSIYFSTKYNIEFAVDNLYYSNISNSIITIGTLVFAFFVSEEVSYTNPDTGETIVYMPGVYLQNDENAKTEYIYLKKHTFSKHLIPSEYIPVIQSDWQENDNEVSEYIKNRTHYVYRDYGDVYYTVPVNTIISDSNGPFYWGIYEDLQNNPFEDGEQCIVVYGGNEYRCDVVKMKSNNGVTYYYAGNGNFYEHCDTANGHVYRGGNDEPFVLSYTDVTHAISVYRKDNIEATVRPKVATYKQLDDEYIPDTVLRWSNQMTEDDALELLADLNVVEPITNENGAVFTDENGAIYVL